MVELKPRKITSERKKIDICTICGLLKARANKRTCSSCGRKQVESSTKYQSVVRLYGKCITCRKLNTTPYSKCSLCLNKSNSYLKKARLEAKITGKCLSCLKVNRLDNLILCLDCWFKEKARLHLGSSHRTGELKVLWSKRKGKCYYTNIELIPGVNASIDHKLPISKYPNSINNIDNLVWCAIRVNEGKQDQTSEEYIDLCRQVVRVADERLAEEN